MFVLAGAVLIAIAVVAAAYIARPAASPSSASDLELRILGTFAPGVAAAQADPRALLAWVPLARAARTLYPSAFAALDRASGHTFPFSDAQIDTAHAAWTADWLAWEQAHTIEYAEKAAVLEAAVRESDRATARGRVDALEREKLDRYQRRYAEYVRIARALQNLKGPPASI